MSAPEITRIIYAHDDHRKNLHVCREKVIAEKHLYIDDCVDIIEGELHVNGDLTVEGNMYLDSAVIHITGKLYLKGKVFARDSVIKANNFEAVGFVDCTAVECSSVLCHSSVHVVRLNTTEGGIIKGTLIAEEAVIGDTLDVETVSAGHIQVSKNARINAKAIVAKSVTTV